MFTADFIASITIFSFFLIFFGIAWNSSILQFVSQEDNSQIEASNTFSLLQTEGHPQNWTESNVSIPGIYEGNYISSQKFLTLKNLSVSEKRSLLRTSEYLLEVRYLNGTVVQYDNRDLSFKSSNISENSSIYVNRKISVLDENRKRVELHYYSWQK